MLQPVDWKGRWRSQLARLQKSCSAQSSPAFLHKEVDATDIPPIELPVFIAPSIQSSLQPVPSSQIPRGREGGGGGCAQHPVLAGVSRKTGSNCTQHTSTLLRRSDQACIANCASWHSLVSNPRLCSNKWPSMRLRVSQNRAHIARPRLADDAQYQRESGPMTAPE